MSVPPAGQFAPGAPTGGLTLGRYGASALIVDCYAVASMGKARAISDEERQLVEQLLVPLGEAAEPYVGQLADARARRNCDCGCPSVELIVSGEHPLGSVAGGLLSEGFARTHDGRPIGLLLWDSDGRLAHLELCPHEGDAPFGVSDLAEVSASISSWGQGRDR